MAIFQKAHSRSKPIIETPIVIAGVDYVNSTKLYTVNMTAPGGPPYVYFELKLSEAEMLNVATGWLSSLSKDYQDLRKLQRESV